MKPGYCFLCEKPLLGRREMKFCQNCKKKGYRLRHEFQGRDYTRELVRVRDKHHCQLCGKKWINGTRRFDVHHLKKYECGVKTRGYDPVEEMPNLITLCHFCHLNLESVKEKMSFGRSFQKS